MDSGDEHISSLKRKSTLELSPTETTGIGRKSSRVHSIASVRAATGKLTGPSKSSIKNRLSNGVGSMSSQKSASNASIRGLGQRSPSLARISSSSSTLSKRHSSGKATLTKSSSKDSLTKSPSKASLTKSPSKASLTKSSSKASLTKSPSKSSLIKSPSKGSLTNAVPESETKVSRFGGKMLWFPKGCHVAVLAQGSRYFLCRLQQNVFNSTKDVKVRWLSVASVRFYPNMYKMSYLDRINPASILMQVELIQNSRLRYLLSSDQEEEIGKVISMVDDVQSGKVSVDDIDDDIQEVVQIDEPPKKRPRLVKTASQHIRDKALKAAKKSSKSDSKSPPRAKKTNGKKPKETKEPKRKVPKKGDDLKLNPRPEFKVLDKDPLFETREPMPYVSKMSNSKLVYRAINLGDASMLKKIFKDGSRIKHVYYKSVSHPEEPFETFVKNPNKEVLAVLIEEFVEGKFEKRHDNNNLDARSLDRLDTGRYNEKSLAVSRILKIQASRGSKEGNNAFLHQEAYCSSMRWREITDLLIEEGMSPSTVEGFQDYLNELKPDKADAFEFIHSRGWDAVKLLLKGRHKEAGHAVKRFTTMARHNLSSEPLMANVLLFETEDLPQCPPSAVKEVCKRLDKITAIHCAAANPNSKYLAKVLSVESNPQVPDAKGRRPVHYAACCSTPDNLKLLLTWRVNTHDTCTSMNTPLHYAIMARRPENVTVLINHDKKADSATDPNVIRYGIGGINRPMKDSLTPLHLAASMGELGIASILLSNGALVNAKTSVSNLQRSPLQIAAGTGNLEMVKLLVGHGAVVEQKDRLGRTALLMACLNGATKLLSYFIHIGANPGRADSSDNTPLHYAAAYGWYFTVKMLMEAGVDPNPVNMWKISPLFVAYMKGHVGIVRLLLGYSTVSINQVLSDGSTLLFHACQSDLTHDDLYEQIEYMVKEKGALCDIKDADGKTALFYLAKASVGDEDKLDKGLLQSTKIAQLLLDNGCDIDAVDNRGFTALMEVLGHVMNTKLAEFLMKKGCRVIAPSDGERAWTVLHAINDNITQSKTGLVKVMDMLKKPMYIKGAREMAKCYDKDGYTPLLKAFLQLKNMPYEDRGEDQSENQEHFMDYVKFLIENLQSPVNGVVAKKDLPLDNVLPSGDSNDWYTNCNEAASSPLMLLLDSLSYSKRKKTLISIVTFLIEHGADLNVVNRSGLTALYKCVVIRDTDLIKLVGGHPSCDVDYEITTKDKTFHLFFACETLDQFEALIDIGCNPNVLSKGDRYTTILQHMYSNTYIPDKRDATLKLLEKLVMNKSKGFPEYDVNTQDWKGQSLLHFLARSNPGTLDTSLELEFKIIQNGGKVGLKDTKGRTPLHYVFKPTRKCMYRSSEIDATKLTQLIAKSMTAEEINAKDYKGRTALHFAAIIGASVSCVILLSQGDKKADISVRDVDGNTALTLAVLHKMDSCAVSLIQSGASLLDDVIDFSVTEKYRQSLLKSNSDKRDSANAKTDRSSSNYWALKEEIHLKKEEKITRTPLYKAAMDSGLQGVAMLISQAEPSESGCSAIDIIKMAFDIHYYNIALEILYNEWGSGKLRKPDSKGRNLLHLLAISCQSDSREENPLICKVADFLIKEKIPVEQQDKEGLYPIHWAIINNHFDLADLLAESSTSYDKDPNGRHFSYLEAALWRVYTNSGITDKVWEYLEKLHKKALDFNRHIRVPLYPALMQPYITGAKKGPEISERFSTTATTALILAIRCSPFKDMFVSKLLKSEVNPNMADVNKVTPLMHAVIQNDKDFVSVLLNHDYPDIPEDKPTSAVTKKNRPNSSVFRLKPCTKIDSESENEESSIEDEEEKKTDKPGLKPIKKTSDVNLDAKDKDGRTALHYVASPLPDGTFDNADIAFLLVSAGAKELKDKRGMTPYALAVKTGAMDVANKLKSLGHGKQDSKCKPYFDRRFPVNDGVVSNLLLQTKPDFIHDAELVRNEQMEDDQTCEYEHKIDESCSVKNGTLLKDEVQDVWYDVLMTRVDVKRHYYPAYNFYKMQLVQQENPNLYILFTQWGCIGQTGQYQHTPFDDLAAAVKEFCKIFRSKSGNKWENINNIQINPVKYRPLDDSARLAPPKLGGLDIEFSTQKCQSSLPSHLQFIMKKMMDPKSLVAAMERISSLSMDCLPFGRLSRGRLEQGRQLLTEINNLILEQGRIQALDDNGRKEKEVEQIGICHKIVELSNEYFHVIPQKGFVYENICPLTDSSTLERHIQAVDNLLHYEVACQMLLGAMARQDRIHPEEYVYRCLDCKIELMKESDPMAQNILKYIFMTSEKGDKVTGIYKIDRDGEAAKLEKTGLENRRLLFHGTSVNNLLSILSRGLTIMFPEHGASYGHGIYFSDTFRKSRNYTDDCGFAFLCEVALGKVHVLEGSDEAIPDDGILDQMFAKHGYNSLIADCADDDSLKNWFKLPSGVSIKMTPAENYWNRPEYVVINPDQVCIRYLIQFEK